MHGCLSFPKPLLRSMLEELPVFAAVVSLPFADLELKLHEFGNI